MVKLDQAWYERAADVIASSYTRPEERLGMLNEIWGEYCFMANRKIAGMTVSYELPDKLIEKMVDDVLISGVGLTLAQIFEYAKEMKANGTQKTEAAAPNPE